MSTPAHVVIETLALAAPFGLGLWDAVTGRLVSEGLTVRVLPLGASTVGRAESAFPNRRGIFVARPRSWDDLSPPGLLLVEVRDTLGRFTPFVMHGTLPASGLVAPPCIAELVVPEPIDSPPPLPSAYVPLFSAPARLRPVGTAVARATLVDAGPPRRPAALAVLEVRSVGRLIGRGVADERGEVAAMFAYPEPPPPPYSPPPASPLSSPLSSPPTSGTAAQPFARQQWTLEVAVRYRRDLPRYVTDPARPPLPDLCELVRQPLADVSSTSPPLSLDEATLSYGEELILGADAGAELLVIPA